MSLCGNLRRTNDLNYCTDSPGASYAGAILHLGELDPDYDFGGATLAVQFKDMATGRITVIEPNEDAYPSIEVIQPGDLSPGQVYQVTLTGPSETVGVTTLQFFPYVYDTTAGGLEPSDTAVDGLFIGFVKMFDGNGDVLSATEQWASLPS